MTRQQKILVSAVLAGIPDTEIIAHHGDCLGADEEFHELVRETVPTAKIHGHPPLARRYRADCRFDVLHEEREYLERDHNIVDSCDVLIACPGEAHERIRSGTWATVRYARKKDHRRVVISPDGMIIEGEDKK